MKIHFKNKAQRIAIFLAFVFSIHGISIKAQLTVTGGLTQAQIQSLLFGPDVTISNFVVKCPNGSFGSFDGTNSNIGLKSGVLLTTGNLNYAPGPNNNGGGGSIGTGGGSDACLEAYKNGSGGCVVGGSCAQAGCTFQSFVNGVCTCMGCAAGATSFDACGIEFDVTPTCDTIKINYVFASEEYPEYVNFNVSDAFAFFISGPGITGTVCSNSKNIALVPGTNTPINIDNVNAGVNSQYYITNGDGTTPTVNKTVQYDGFTKVLTAKTKVTPCAKYHIKMVIADFGDYKFDSGVFLQKGGINCGTPSLAASQVDAIECCSNNGSFTLTLAQAPLTPLTIAYTLGGTATSGADYTPLPGSIVVPAGQTSVTIPVNVLCDNIAEGAETITLNVGQAVCAGALNASATLTISNGPTANAGPDVTICSTGTTLNATGGGTYSWSPATGLSCTTCASPVATPLVTTKYVVAVTNNGCTARDTVLVTVSCGPTIAVAGETVCTGNCKTLTATTSGGTAPYAYSWSSGATGPTFSACPTATTTYTVKATDNTGATNTATATVTIYPVTNLSIAKTDVSCDAGTNGTATVTATAGKAPYNYSWSVQNGTSSTISGLGPGTYIVTSTDVNGCTQTANIVITQPPPITLSPTSGSAGCGTSNGNISVTGSGGTGTLTYSWSNGSGGQTVNGVSAGSYTVTATDSKSCTKSLVITVSNIPAPTINNLT